MFTVETGRVEEAIEIMREVSLWGQALGLRVWPLDWLTPEALLTPDAPPESFCVGYLNWEPAGCMILQWQDRVWWPDAPYGQAAYLHKLCVRPPFAGMGIPQQFLTFIRRACTQRGASYIRLDTGLQEPVVRDIYLNLGFRIVKKIEYDHGRGMLLYEAPVQPGLIPPGPATEP